MDSTSPTLTQIELNNFRCFDNHKVIFQKNTLLVGKNNAGKSTCVEALRLVSLVTERMNNLPLKTPPKELELGKTIFGIKPNLKAIAIRKQGIYHNYGAPPAIINVIFSNNAKLRIYIGEYLTIYAVIYKPDGKIARNRQSIIEASIPRVSILPQIEPVSEYEKVLGEEYVKANIQTSRCSLHFRNQLYRFNKYFDHFKEKVSSTWAGLKIIDLDIPPITEPDRQIGLLIRDCDFTAEIAWMGHGLQMWLQTMWFLSRSQESSVLILDEPDVYMHADLQRKLIRMLMQDNRQFIIATHSPEMLSEVEHESVIVLDRYSPISRSATSVEGVQQLLEHVGSIHNIMLAKLSMHKRILLVEGHDIPILKMFQNAFSPSATYPIDAIPNSNIGGWSKWPSVLNIAKFFKKNTPQQIKVFCLLDRDYHTQEDIVARKKDAEKHGVSLHIWDSKELENYAISPITIARIISNESENFVSVDNVSKIISDFADNLMHSTIDDYSEAIRLQTKQGANKSNPKARKIVAKRWEALGGISVVSGKSLFANIAGWSQKQYGVCLSIRKVIREMRPNEVPTEVVSFIENVTKTSI